MVRSRMMDDYPLTLPYILERCATYFPKNEIVSRLPDGTIHRYTYGDFARRTKQLANALRRLGVEQGERVGTLCWNSYWHMECYLGIPAMGGVLHTLNLRLHPNDLTYIANHAEDRVIIADRSLLPVLEQFKDRVKSLRHVIVIPDDGAVPEGYLDYEEVLAAESETFVYPEIDERDAAAMCYTSGTTGNPKGVLYSHRSTFLHTMTECMADTAAISEADCVLPVVPMFHANAWGVPFAAALVGAKLVFPGRDLSPETLVNLMAQERVTLSEGVPTIWLGILSLLDANPGKWDLSSIRSTLVGGSAAPPAMIDGFLKRHGIPVVHAWGMTEMSPIGTISRVKRSLRENATDAQVLKVKSTQGYAVPLVELRHVDDMDRVLPWDGKTMGELEVRGPWVASSYYNNTEQQDRFTSDGWFRTGDIVTINEDGYISITDRSKDVIKSGGEWISTVELENALMAHPAVLEAAVFAARHPKWDERPLAAVVFKAGQSAPKEELLEMLAPQFAKFWLPDDILVLEEIPKTSTGKFQKLTLRERYGDYLVRNG